MGRENCPEMVQEPRITPWRTSDPTVSLLGSLWLLPRHSISQTSQHWSLLSHLRDGSRLSPSHLTGLSLALSQLPGAVQTVSWPSPGPAAAFFSLTSPPVLGQGLRLAGQGREVGRMQGDGDTAIHGALLLPPSSRARPTCTCSRTGVAAPPSSSGRTSTSPSTPT